MLVSDVPDPSFTASNDATLRASSWLPVTDGGSQQPGSHDRPTESRNTRKRDTSIAFRLLQRKNCPYVARFGPFNHVLLTFTRDA